MALRTLAERNPTFLEGDLALLHIDSLRAAGLHQLLGPYDRFGWHHPGPAYAYLMSVTDRLVGFTHPLSAEALTAMAIDGGSFTAAVAVARRHLGAGPAAGVLVLGWLAMVGLGNDAVFNPWSPTVVVLPAVLLVVMAVASTGPAARRGPAGLGLAAGALVVGTFCLQTDLGTLPLVAPLVVVVLLSPLVGRLGRRSRPVGKEANPPGSPGAGAAATFALGAIAAAAWVPVLVDEWSSRPGNLTRIFDFFTAAHRHAGVRAGVRAAGWAQLALFGHRPPGAPPVGATGSWAALAAWATALLLLAVGLRLGRPVAAAGAIVWLLGTALVVLAGAEIVGPPYAYLTYWAAAPLAGAAVALGDLSAALVDRARRAVPVADAHRSGRGEIALLLVTLLSGLGVTGDLLSRHSVISYSPAPVATAWSDVHLLVPGHGPVGVAYPNQADAWNIGTGLVDRLEEGGRAVAVLPFWSNQVVTTSPAPPSTWISILPAGSSPPKGVWRPAGTVGRVSLFVGPRPAPGGD